FDKSAAARDTRRRIDEIRCAQVDEQGPAALQERQRIAVRDRGRGDAPVLQRRDRLGAGAELENGQILFGIETDMTRRRPEIEMGRRAEARDRGGFALE